MTQLNVLSLTPNPTIDKSSAIDRVAPEIKLRCDDPTFEPGGGGVNVCRVLDRLEVPTRLLYPAGGPHGNFLQELLTGEGLDHEAVPINGITRESYMVRETSTGHQYRFSHPGPELSSEEWGAVTEKIGTILQENVPYLVGSGSLPPGVGTEGYAEIGSMVRESDARFILDTSGDFLRNGLEGHPFLIKPNLRELAQIVGREIEGDREICNVSRELIDREQTDNVVVSIGAGGALLISREGQYRFRAPTVNIDSKVGAGDSMVGGIVYGLLATDSVREAVKYGVAAGTAAVKTPGTQLCYPEDVHELVDRVGVSEWNHQ